MPYSPSASRMAGWRFGFRGIWRLGQGVCYIFNKETEAPWEISPSAYFRISSCSSSISAPILVVPVATHEVGTYASCVSHLLPRKQFMTRLRAYVMLICCRL